MAVIVIKRKIRQQFQPLNVFAGISNNTAEENRKAFTEEALRDMRRRYSLIGQVKAMSTRD